MSHSSLPGATWMDTTDKHWKNLDQSLFLFTCLLQLLVCFLPQIATAGGMLTILPFFVVHYVVI